jgi:hypothetical protein
MKQTLSKLLKQREEVCGLPNRAVTIKNDRVMGIYDCPNDVRDLAAGRFFQSVQLVQGIVYVGDVAVIIMGE